MNHARVTEIPPEPGTRPIAADGAAATRTGPASASGPHASGSPRLSGHTLISIADIRRISGLGRTAGYELARRAGFPDPVTVSTRCYRWWASEVDAFAAVLRHERAQPAARRTARPGLPGPGTRPRRITGTVRAAVIELEDGMKVYPAREEHGRWRAVWYEDGERQQCEAASEDSGTGR